MHGLCTTAAGARGAGDGWVSCPEVGGLGAECAVFHFLCGERERCRDFGAVCDSLAALVPERLGAAGALHAEDGFGAAEDGAGG